jgi:hypothetical protein
MIRHCFSRRLIYSLGFVLLAAGILGLYSRAARAGQDAQQGQQQPAQTDQTQGQGQQQEKPKKKGGFFGGLKAVSGSSSNQTSYTASAGAKGIGDEGAKIGEITPTAADRQAVTQMENTSVAQGDLSKFIEGGKLKSKQ